MSDTHVQAPLPSRLPEPGFYYHYKHDPQGTVNNYAYLILGAGHHTEDDARPEDTFMQVYWPLYESYVYTHGNMFDLRPLDMALDTVENESYTGPRFIKITDEAVLAELKQIGRKMYGDWFW